MAAVAVFLNVDEEPMTPFRAACTRVVPVVFSLFAWKEERLLMLERAAPPPAPPVLDYEPLPEALDYCRRYTPAPPLLVLPKDEEYISAS